MVSSSYCQKISVSAGDTSAVLPIDWLKQINLDYNSFDRCREEVDTLKSILLSYRFQRELHLLLIGEYKNQIASQHIIIDSQTSALIYQGKNKEACEERYIRMVHWKNIEIGAVIIAGIIGIWRVSK